MSQEAEIEDHKLETSLSNRKPSKVNLGGYKVRV